MSKNLLAMIVVQVALYTSAWIEIPYLQLSEYLFSVALYTSAWIEIERGLRIGKKKESRTLHECVD